MTTNIPVTWSNFWSSRVRFPLLVDLAVEEDRYTFGDDGVTFFADMLLRTKAPGPTSSARPRSRQQ